MAVYTRTFTKRLLWGALRGGRKENRIFKIGGIAVI